MSKKRDILFIHPNFPGQFRRLASAIGGLDGWRAFGIGDLGLMEWVDLGRGRVIGYQSPHPPGCDEHLHLRGVELAVRRGRAAMLTARALQQQGVDPDIILVHSGWGDGLFLKELFPRAKVVGYFEFFYRLHGADVGFDREFPVQPDDPVRLRLRNIVNLMTLESCDHGVSPTAWQRSLFPGHQQERIEVIHEGIDTDRIAPDPDAIFRLDQQRVLTARSEVLTYVSRGLEPYRGFHSLMRALPRIMASRPDCEVVIVGEEATHYGRQPPEGRSYKQIYLEEVAGDIDRSRLHFTGAIPYQSYINLLQISSVHLYLTYPFVLSWSMLEAMAAGALVVGSATPPVEEVIEHQRNGLLVDFFDHDAIAGCVIDALAENEALASLRRAARMEMRQRYDFNRVALPAYHALIERMV